ncbi:MAG TPA: hypothetical protein VMZ53_13670 [Kofleriaceae bacterium]|nr:hypothetical protein [Kofleriaceae bacterium]
MKRALVICLLLVGCESGEGERCQVDSDCANGLVCNKAKNVCTTGKGGDLDASVPDGPPADAVPDAP